MLVCGRGPSTGSPRGPGLAALGLAVAALVAAAGVPAYASGLVLAGDLPPAESGAPYAATLRASGGTPPYAFSAQGLPGGLSLAQSGAVSGTPRAAGTFVVDVEVTDQQGLRASTALDLTVAPGPTITTASLPTATAGADYDAELTASGGQPPYTWSVASGPVPPGTLLSSEGVLSGRPGGPGRDTLDVEVTDALGSSATRVLTLVVVAPPPPPQEVALASASGQVLLLGAQAETLRAPRPPRSRLAGIAGSAVAGALYAAWRDGRVVGVGTRGLGSVPARRLASPVVGIAADGSRPGYWLVTARGQVYGFGAARRLGPVVLGRRTGPVVGIAAARGGYLLATARGAVVAVGPAPRGRRPGGLAGRVVGIAAERSGPGYWLLTARGRVYGFDGAPRLGSVRTARAVAIAAAPRGVGYFVATAAGGLYAFGSARLPSGEPRAVVGARVVALAATG